MHALSSIPCLPAAAETPLGAEVYRGLTAMPKKLSPWIFYDERGSELFEAITELPEYYLTRTERDIFAQSGAAMVESAADGQELAVIELGAGTAVKTDLLLRAAVGLGLQVSYYPIDISGTALDEAARRLGEELPQVAVEARLADYTRDLRDVAAPRCRRLVLSIGSSLGNFEPEAASALLSRLRRRLAAGDCLLLGVDHVKDRGTLLRAYNDAAGVTAEFNGNALARINRELHASFRTGLFRHRAVWNERESRVEMHLESLIAQEVAIRDLELTVNFQRGESIHTENCYKFTGESVARLFARSGFAARQSWTDAKGWFGVYLAEAV
ncbi:MAG TPA: L-histidine N(alpha)-methyltransferase [Acidobacteriaceae bacterium]|jgi:dimethylhistidine N-methyltransferase|nr:L-histidine N(alpha)-methyltransferase [Acidobacteriaceae bacterium]